MEHVQQEELEQEDNPGLASHHHTPRAATSAGTMPWNTAIGYRHYPGNGVGAFSSSFKEGSPTRSETETDSSWTGREENSQPD